MCYKLRPWNVKIKLTEIRRRWGRTVADGIEGLLVHNSGGPQEILKLLEEELSFKQLKTAVLIQSTRPHK